MTIKIHIYGAQFINQGKASVAGVGRGEAGVVPIIATPPETSAGHLVNI